MKFFNITIILIGILLLSASGAQIAFAKSPHGKRLEKVHQKIVKDYPNLSHISREALQDRLKQSSDDLILLDTRPLSEFRISHIEGAIQVDPDIEASKLDALDLEGKTVIVYCSVGRRSSALASRLQSEFKHRGSHNVINMNGGLFGWHNDERPMVNTKGVTDIIHPYNGFWSGRYLAHKDKTAYSLK